MQIDIPILLSSVAAIVGVFGGVFTATAYNKLANQHKALKTQFQTLISKNNGLNEPIPKVPVLLDSDRLLLRILEDFNARKIPDSVALERAIPLLANRISPIQYHWLTQELDGYKGEPGLLEPPNPNLQTYRLVYADQLKMQIDGVVHADLSWPPAANRLIFLSLPLADIERKIADKSTDTFAARTGMSFPGLPANVEAVGLFDKSQLQRLSGRFRQEFSNLLCGVLKL